MENLEAEIDHLYALDPAAFTAARDGLARELREAGKREEAAQVKQLRKPTLPAWTINQLARQERRAVDLLLDAGHRLLDAQQGLVSGEAVGDQVMRAGNFSAPPLRPPSLYSSGCMVISSPVHSLNPPAGTSKMAESPHVWTRPSGLEESTRLTTKL